MVWHESSLENSHLIVVAAHADYDACTSQALDLQWSHAGMELQHIPDLVIELRSGGTLVVDCRDVDYRDNDTFITQVALTASMCREVGWSYELWDRLPSQLDCSLRDLENFAILDQRVADAAREFAADCPRHYRSVAGFKAHAEKQLEASDGTAALKHALWRGYLHVDLCRPIRTHSELSTGNEEAGLVLDGLWRQVVVA